MKNAHFLNKDGTIRFEPHENANICQKDLLRANYQSCKKNYPIAPNKFNGETTKDYYTDIFYNNINEFKLFNVSEDVAKKMNKATGRKLSAKYLKQAADVLALSTV